jgi:hypothetical protein
MNYPFELQRREAAAIRVRREKAAPLAVSAKEEGETPPEDTPTGVGLGRLPPRTVGLTLSGGGAVWLEIARRRLVAEPRSEHRRDLRRSWYRDP